MAVRDCLNKWKYAFLFVLVSSSINALAQPSSNVAQAQTKHLAQPSACPAILHFTFHRLQDNSPQNLCQYAGKVILVVNTASYCGFTKQYTGLEALYAKYANQGFVVLGFPSNDFGKQEPGSSKEIADFCFNTFGVKFPMFAKSSVTGDQVNPLYTVLAKRSGVTPKWNFYKYLIDRSGHIVNSYASAVTPNNESLVSDIERALKTYPAENSFDMTQEDELVVDDIEKSLGM